MSKILDKFVYKLLIVIIVAALWVGFRQMVLTDKVMSTAFGALMGELPFAKKTVDIVCKIMKYSAGNIPVQSAHTVFTDVMRLLVMAVIQPIFVGMLTAIFLPMPKARNQILSVYLKRYEEEEAYQSSFGYKIKKLIVSVISAPLLAICASWITGYVVTCIKDNFSGAAAVFIGGLSVTAVLILSVVVLMMFHVSLGTAMAWRLLITVGTGMATTFMTNGLCMWIYVAILSGVEAQIFASVLTLILFLIVMEVAVKALKRSIV